MSRQANKESNVIIASLTPNANTGTSELLHEKEINQEILRTSIIQSDMLASGKNICNYRIQES